MLRERRGLGPLAAAELDRVVEAANADDPDHRQLNACVLADDLEAWLAQRPTSRTPSARVVRVGLALTRVTGISGGRRATTGTGAGAGGTAGRERVAQ